jgi:hypothetical protein
MQQAAVIMPLRQGQRLLQQRLRQHWLALAN